MNGIINVYKEKGFTSHDVVAKLRGILHMKKIGHTGTLDPDAVGVLPVCLGKGTGLCSMITDWTKTYEAVMLLVQLLILRIHRELFLRQERLMSLKDRYWKFAAALRENMIRFPQCIRHLRLMERSFMSLQEQG